jgi:NADH:ubiquinone oxidoreductase subunit 3 (subunit A)
MNILLFLSTTPKLEFYMFEFLFVYFDTAALFVFSMESDVRCSSFHAMAQVKLLRVSTNHVSQLDRVAGRIVPV